MDKPETPQTTPETMRKLMTKPAQQPLVERINPGDPLRDECPQCGSASFEDMQPADCPEFHLCQCYCGRAWHYIEAPGLLKAAGMTP